MLIDDVKIEVTAGKGGDGAVLFSRTKMTLGPTGGDGGHGSNVFLEGVSNIGALTPYRHRKTFRADDGKSGAQNRKTGKDGTDLVLKVPVGTVIHFLSTTNPETERKNAKVQLINQNESIAQIEKIGQRVLVARGGKGGRGNYTFRSATNTTPKESTAGTLGQSVSLRLELKLIADVGFIGFPNAGKSSLLNALTNAQSKVANYPFTTLEPNLGAYYELILADIPGLIEGASTGKGLGIKFLRHVERTQVLFHLISAESNDPVKEYQTIRAELAAYNPLMAEKKEYVFLSKTDLCSDSDIKKKLAKLTKRGIPALPLTIQEPASIQKVQVILNQLQQEKMA